MFFQDERVEEGIRGDKKASVWRMAEGSVRFFACSVKTLPGEMFNIKTIEGTLAVGLRSRHIQVVSVPGC